jgi:hypothetical protein
MLGRRSLQSEVFAAKELSAAISALASPCPRIYLR